MKSKIPLKLLLLVLLSFFLQNAFSQTSKGFRKPDTSSEDNQYPNSSNSQIPQYPNSSSSRLPQYPNRNGASNANSFHQTFKYGYVITYAFYSLPFKDVDESNLTKSQCRIIAAELKRRLIDYKTAISEIENRLEALGEAPEKEEQEDDSKTNIETNSANKSKSANSNEKSDDMTITLPDGASLDASNGVLIVEHKTASGTAFIATMRGRNFIVTNLHVIAENEGLTFKTKNGYELSFPNVVFIAKGQDAVLIPIDSIPQDAIALEIMENVSTNVKRGDLVVACGNSEGGEVLQRSPGEVLAVGPSVLETSCAIFKGNSGSPIFHKSSGKVIGVISHAITASDGLNSETRRQSNSPIKNKIRYFGQRIDNTKDWEKMTLSDLNDQAKDLSIFRRKLGIMQEFESGGKLLVYKDLNYSDYHKITRVLSGTASSNGAVKSARREYYEKTANLIKHEIALIKARKFSSVFTSQIDSLINEFDLQRNLCIERARAQDL